MKARIIEVLAHPRALVTGEQDLEDCHHNGLYSLRHGDCSACPQGPECRWLYQHGEYAALEDKSLAQLEEALAFALGYVDSRILEWGHDCVHCKCEHCAWLRAARRLYDQLLAAQNTA